jgi:glycosyltransferase involved in cell wall biosynthesis
MAKIQTGKTVCLITPGHISSNPRLVKEAMALSQSGYKLHLIFTQYVGYLVDHDQQILSANPTWTYDNLNWTGHNLASKCNRFLSKIVQLFNADKAMKLNRNYLWQLKKALACKADLYIAHNLSALPVAVIAAKKNNTKCGFDAEDFHRNEVSDDPANEDVKLKTAIEEKYISQVDYMTASSPQIADAYENLFNRKIITILNVFPKTGAINIINNTSEPLQLFWFSQTIGPNRGLETIIEAINSFAPAMDLHLLGTVGNEYKQQLMSSIKNLSGLHFHQPVIPDELFSIAAKFDIGFTAEPGFSINNKIALSNKLFTYLQSGLAILTSDTPAQTAFLNQYPHIGSLYHNAQELSLLLISYHNNRELLYTTKVNNYKLGQEALNWETESKKLISTVQNVLN